MTIILYGCKRATPTNRIRSTVPTLTDRADSRNMSKEIFLSVTKIERYEDGSIRKTSNRSVRKKVLDRRAEPADSINGGTSFSPSEGSRVSLHFDTADTQFYLSMPASVFKQFADFVLTSESFKP